MKFSKYNIPIEMDYGIVLYNSRQAKCVQIYKQEELAKFKELLKNNCFDANDDMVKALYKRGYIVDEDIDEYEEVKKEISDYINNSRRTLEIMLYVTENCNFRCTYCFEEHLDKRFSAENWDALYKYIENSLEKNLYDIVQFSFFGGEPLLELNAILKFLDKIEVLKRKYPKVYFAHQMTTNGYLLTPNTYNKLVNRDVVNYQITIDGFAEDHNKTRPLAGGGGTWDKIIENLKYINSVDDNKSTVVVRLNVSSSNVSKINDFINWFSKTFDKQKIQLDIETVSDFSEKVDKQMLVSWENNEYKNAESLNSKNMQNTDALQKYGFACGFMHANNYTISVEGKIRKCENAYGEDFDYIGALSKGGELILEPELLAPYELGFETENCKVCIGYPLCCGRRCPDKKVHFPETRPDCLYKFYKGANEPYIETLIKREVKNIFYNLKKGNER